MKRIILISLSVIAFALVACKKKGVCTCSVNGGKTKTYYEELSVSEKKAMKSRCNGDSDGKQVKRETIGNNVTVTDDKTYDLNEENCEWSRTGKDD